MAIGAIGLSLTDFCCLTPSEWNAVHKAYIDRENTIQRGEWERMRLLATITIQPHCKRRINARQLLPFPWDNESRKESQKIVSREESKESFERRMKMLESNENEDNNA